MRNFIDIAETLLEYRLRDGAWSDLTSRDLVKLASKEDLRGIAWNNKIFVWPALDAIHAMKADVLGIPRDYRQSGGFNFYCFDPNFETNDWGRDAWGEEGDIKFTVGDISVSTDRTDDVTLANKSFARMIGK